MSLVLTGNVAALPLGLPAAYGLLTYYRSCGPLDRQLTTFVLVPAEKMKTAAIAAYAAVKTVLP